MSGKSRPVDLAIINNIHIHFEIDKDSFSLTKYPTVFYFGPKFAVFLAINLENSLEF